MLTPPLSSWLKDSRTRELGVSAWKHLEMSMKSLTVGRWQWESPPLEMMFPFEAIGANNPRLESIVHKGRGIGEEDPVTRNL